MILYVQWEKNKILNMTEQRRKEGIIKKGYIGDPFVQHLARKLEGRRRYRTE